ncbi:hypothetical protein B0H19DRAFT_1140923 [Mycena capillaripes]|nr:hypothetical protein B0H19DRAFT_1140923 [Mycena capillaripes]
MGGATVIQNHHCSRLPPRSAGQVRNRNHPLAIQSGVLISLMNARESLFFKHSVRNLLLSQRPAQEEAVILSACSGIQNLWTTSERASWPLLPRLDHLQLKRLHCTLESIFDSDMAFTFNHSLFARITHLEIFDAPNAVEPQIWCGLAHIPHLSHLAFNSTDFISICRSLLRTCESLRLLCIILSRRPDDIGNAGDRALSELKEDPRFVMMACYPYIEDWIDGAHRGCDCWSRAEDFMAKRKSGQINPLEYYLNNPREV